MTQTNDLKEIGALFKKHRYIISNNGFKQYNLTSNTFINVPTDEVMEIFNKLFINFERIPITTKLLTPYLPTITDKQFETYNICREIENNNLKQTIDKKIARAVETNNKRKIDIPGKIIADDYKNQVQFLINNDVFTNGKSLFKYNDGAIKLMTPKEVSNIIKPYINVIRIPFDLNKLIQFSLYHLTKINIDYKKKLQIDNLTKQDWQKYQEINQLLNSYKVQ